NSIPVATARSGNVIGGRDFSKYRLIPDCFRALHQNLPITVRNPESTRPWLHVLDPLYGYLLLAAKLMSNDFSFAQAWNFGPREREGMSAKDVVETAISSWGKGGWIDGSS